MNEADSPASYPSTPTSSTPSRPSRRPPSPRRRCCVMCSGPSCRSSALRSMIAWGWGLRTRCWPVCHVCLSPLPCSSSSMVKGSAVGLRGNCDVQAVNPSVEIFWCKIIKMRLIILRLSSQAQTTAAAVRGDVDIVASQSAKASHLQGWGRTAVWCARVRDPA